MLKNLDTVRARQFWEEYQLKNDLGSHKGKIAAIDPESERVWIGDSAIDIADRMRAEGFQSPVYLVRIGLDHLIRKRRGLVTYRIVRSSTEDSTGRSDGTVRGRRVPVPRDVAGARC